MDTELAELDDDDFDWDTDWDDDGDLIAMEFTEAMAEVDLANVTRKDIRGLKQLLRKHPAVDGILDDWVHDRDDQSAVSALGALVEGWGITTLDGQKAASVSLEALEDYLGQCAWPGCSLPRKERQGSRGRHPKHCLKHTFEKKRQDDRERLRLKRSGTLKLSECCKEWSRSGHRGPCQQHRDNDSLSRPAYPLSAIEAAYLGAGGFHLV